MNQSQERARGCENCYFGRPFPQEKWEGEPQPIGYDCAIKEVPPDLEKSCPKWKARENIEKPESKSSFCKLVYRFFRNLLFPKEQKE